jgi:hypothetical protein
LRFPYRVKDLKAVQKNFDYLTTKLSGAYFVSGIYMPFAGNGAYPRSGAYPARGGDVWAIWGGTGFSVATGLQTLSLLHDGTPVDTLDYFFNAAGDHRFMGVKASYLGVPTIANHTIGLTFTGASDVNDSALAWLIEVKSL